VPIYEYTCEECETRFEKFVRSMTAAVKARCPICGSSRIKKGWSTFGTGPSGGGLAVSSSSCSPSG